MYCELTTSLLSNMKRTKLDDEKLLLHEIEKASDSIRRKHKLLKFGRVENERITSEVLGPITEPLRKILAGASKTKKKSTVSFNKKNEKEVENDDEEADSDEEEENEIDEEEENEQSSQNNNNNNDEEGKNFIYPSTFHHDNISDDGDNDTDDDVLGKKKKIWMMKKQMESRKSINSINKIHNTMYTIRKLKKNNKLMFGDSEIKMKNNHIYVANKIYPATQGLLELLFKTSPNASFVRKVDQKIFIEIIKLTNAHRKSFVPDGALLTNRTQKYKNYISLFIKSLRIKDKKSGSALHLPQYKTIQKNKNTMDYIYWDDPNELVNRLQLLVASEKAGNNNHSNEILSIIEELKEAGIIC